MTWSVDPVPYRLSPAEERRRRNLREHRLLPRLWDDRHPEETTSRDLQRMRARSYTERHASPDKRVGP